MQATARAAALERALTAGGVGRTPNGELSEVTRGIYAKWYGVACAWKRSELGSSSRTFTPEQVAACAAWLIEQGYARATAQLAVRAIRWGHRVAGEPVPDGLPASYVLREADPTADDHDAVNDLDAPARREPHELLTGLAAACNPSTARGRRDLAILCLLYYGGLSVETISRLDVGDLLPVSVDGPIDALLRDRPAYSVPSPRGHVVLDHLPADAHYPTMCPACTLREWLRVLYERGGATGADPLFRQIDKGDNVAGTLDRYGGRTDVRPEGRLAHRSISVKVMRRLAVDAGLGELIPAPARAIRLAGACAAFVRGDVDAAGAARHAGYTPGSGLFVNHLLGLL